jgi:hypothetical protein
VKFGRPRKMTPRGCPWDAWNAVPGLNRGRPLGHKRVTAAERKRRQRNLLPHLKIFFAKTPSTERLPPFWVKPFLDRFLGEGA